MEAPATRLSPSPLPNVSYDFPSNRFLRAYECAYEMGLNTPILAGAGVPPELPLWIGFITLQAHNTVMPRWSANVGKVYQIQYRDDFTSRKWLFASDDYFAANKNQLMFVLPLGPDSRIYRVIQPCDDERGVQL